MSRASARASLRVLLAGDHTAQRDRLVAALQSEGDISVECVPGAATAVRRVEASRPDVVILDLTLRDGNGVRAIEQIMAHTPTPILVLSARIEDRKSPSAAEALVAGALDALPRPATWTPKLAADLRRAVRQISRAHVIRHPRGSRAPGPSRPQRLTSGQPVVAIGASTGGPGALATVLAGLGGLEAPVLVVQHLHPEFVRGLVEWMSRVSPLPVETAVHGRVARPGRVYFAPGERHLRYGATGRLELSETPRTAHRPSADELFGSVARASGRTGIGVLLTGMGDDGARGLLAIHQQGGRTLAQDEESCAVFGMPKAALRIGAVTDLLPVDKVADAIQRTVREVRQG